MGCETDQELGYIRGKGRRGDLWSRGNIGFLNERAGRTPGHLLSVIGYL